MMPCRHRLMRWFGYQYPRIHHHQLDDLLVWKVTVGRFYAAAFGGDDDDIFIGTMLVGAWVAERRFGVIVYRNNSSQSMLPIVYFTFCAVLRAAAAQPN